MRFKSPSFFQLIHKRSVCMIILFFVILLGGVGFLPSFAAMPIVHAATMTHITPSMQKKSSLDSSFYTDTVLIVDNVNLIRTHDPDGYRYTAAQLYVNLAPLGDRVGLVEITSSPAPKKILDLQDMNSQGKALVNQKLDSFGPVDTNPTAYFTPALLAAKDMLNQGQSRNNRKYAVIVTDVVAESGDQGPCADSWDQLHNWVCTVKDMENQGITVILIGFSAPGSQAALIPTANYIDAHGGTVLTVADGADVAQRLAQTYTELLTRTHPNIFLAKFNGIPDTVTISEADKLTFVSFVSLGPIGTSFGDIQTPANQHVAGQNSNDGSYLSASGRGYSLETIGGGSLVGDWHLRPGNIPPNQVFIVGVSEGKFELLNPGPAFPNSEVGLRYIAPQEPIILRARVTKADNTPPVGISFTADPGSGNASPFSSDTIPVTSVPDNQQADMSAILSPSSTDSITVGLGQQVATGVYFLKTYPVTARPELGNRGIQLTVPPSTLLPIGGSVNISVQGTTSSSLNSLAIYARQKLASPNIPWISVASNSANNTTISGSFTPPKGCGTTYEIDAIEEVSGTLPGNSNYDYLTYDTASYSANIQQGTTADASLSSNPYLEWWSSQASWKLHFSTTVCVPQTIVLQATLSGKNGFDPPSVTQQSGSGIFNIAANSPTDITYVASINNCSFDLLSDRTALLQLQPSTDVKAGNNFTPRGPAWNQIVTCPSALTNTRRYPFWATIILLFLSVLVVRAGQLIIWPFVPRRHIIGNVEVRIEVPELVANVGGATESTSEEVAPVTFRVPNRVPVHSGTWYLTRRISGTDVLYSFETHDSGLAVLAFSIFSPPGIKHTVGVAASKNATGENLPKFQVTGLPVGLEPVICEGEAIIVGNDLITPELKIV